MKPNILKTIGLLAIAALFTAATANAQLLQSTIRQETQSVASAGDNLARTLTNVTRMIESQVTRSHVVIFEDLGTAGTKALLAQTLAKGAANVSELTLKLTPTESVRVMTAVQDLAQGNAITATVSDLTDKEKLVAQFVALSASTYTLPESRFKANAAFTVAVQPNGSVVATTVVPPAPPAPAPPAP